MDAYLGLIFPFAGAFAPQGTVQCWGQDLPTQQNQALFAIVGTMYGGTPNTSFKVPDLRGRVMLGSGTSPYLNNTNLPVASSGGAAAMTINLSNLPLHTHNATFTPGGGSSTSTITANVTIPVGTTPGSQASPSAGSNNWLAGVNFDDGGSGAAFNGLYTNTNPGAGASLTGTASGSVTVTGGAGTVAVSPGGGQAAPVPLSNVQPYLAVTFYIVTMGLFPTRD